MLLWFRSTFSALGSLMTSGLYPHEYLRELVSDGFTTDTPYNPDELNAITNAVRPITLTSRKTGAHYTIALVPDVTGSDRAYGTMIAVNGKPSLTHYKLTLVRGDDELIEVITGW